MGSSPLPDGRVPRAGARRVARAVVQIVGFALGLGLFGWVIAVALSPKNREQLAHLSEAPWQDVALLLGLSVLTVFNNGALFWLTIRPVHRLRLPDVVAVNAVASALAYLPFKLSMLFRFLVHNRRDRLPVLTIGAWLAAFAVVMLSVLVPVGAATQWRRQIDGPWWGVVVGGVLLLAGSAVGVACLVRRDAVWARLARLLAGPDGRGRGLIGRLLVRMGAIERIHEGVRMLAHPVTVTGSVLLRGFDLCVLALRFSVAAKIAGEVLPADQAALIASAYFLIGAVAPTGQMGFREIGVVAMRDEAFAVVVLTVTAAEMVVNAACAVAGAAWLRVDRLLEPSARPAQSA